MQRLNLSFLFILFNLLATPLYSSAGKETSDSLLLLLESTTHDSIKTRLLNDISWEFRSNKPDSCIYYAELALQLSVKNEIHKETGRSYNIMASAFTNKGNYDKAVNFFIKALELYAQINDRKREAMIYNNLGYVYSRTGDHKKAFDYFQKSLVIKKDIGDAPGLAQTYIHIGLLHNEKGDYEKAIEYHKLALEIEERAENKTGAGNALNNLGMAYANLGDYDMALECYDKSLQIKKETGDKKKMANTLNNIGIIHKNQGNYDKAIDYLMQSLKIREEVGDKSGMAGSYNNIGLLYQDQGNSEKALEYYLKCLEIDEETGYKAGIASSLNNVGTVYKALKEYGKAMEYYKKSLVLRKELEDLQGIASSYSNIGSLYTDIFTNRSKDTELQREGKEYLPEYALLDSALAYHMKGYELKKEIGYKLGMIYSLAGLGNILFQKKEYGNAIYFYSQAANIADSIGVQKELYEAYRLLAESYAGLNDFSKAYEFHKKYALLRDSIHNKESIDKIAELESMYKNEQRQKEIALLRKDQELQKAELKRKQLMLIGSGGMFLLLLIFSILLLKRFRLTKKQNLIIENQKAQVDIAYSSLQEKNEQIVDSINYARHIQNALLQEEKYISLHLPDHFILFQPKDIVSGDFYWGLEKQNHWYIAVADCTGHGVPGAFMSMLGIAYLNEITNTEFLLSPAEVLDRLREKIILELNQTDIDRESKNGSSSAIAVKDGMDISLARINMKSNELQWAGANNPLWLIRDGKILNYAPDKQPIGFCHQPKPFINHSLQLQRDDLLYIFSDGYADQFGGPRGKKFKYAQFKSLLLKNSTKPMTEQKTILMETLNNWRGELEQIDDICVIGVKI